MRLPVYTSLLRLERRLNHVGGLELPRPVTLTEAGVFALTLGTLVLLMRVAHISVGAGWLWVYVVVPWAASVAATRPLADRKRLHQWGTSQLRYLLAEPRALTRMRPASEPQRLSVCVETWQPAERLLLEREEGR
jgi:hypothetical protein